MLVFDNSVRPFRAYKVCVDVNIRLLSSSPRFACVVSVTLRFHFYCPDSKVIEPLIVWWKLEVGGWDAESCF